MEFLRFGSSIPGGSWGCCAGDIVQNFKVDPDAPASIEMVIGDSGQPMIKNGQVAYAGPTWKDIFLTRLRVGTFGSNDMPNHFFIAVLTSQQISGGVGLKWLAILKECGFEFIRTVDNSVYTGPGLREGEGEVSAHPNYMFGLFRNIGEADVGDMFTPPPAWSSLPAVTAEPTDYLSSEQKAELKAKQEEAHRIVWNRIGPPKYLTEAELREKNVPVTRAGRRMPGAAPELKRAEAPKPAKQANAAFAPAPALAPAPMEAPSAALAPAPMEAPSAALAPAPMEAPSAAPPPHAA